MDNNNDIGTVARNIELRDHVCSIYRNKEEQFKEIIPFIKTGLEQNLKCLYIADDNSKDTVISRLKDGGIDVEKYLQTKQFLLLTKKRNVFKRWFF